MKLRSYRVLNTVPYVPERLCNVVNATINKKSNVEKMNAY